MSPRRSSRARLTQLPLSTSAFADIRTLSTTSSGNTTDRTMRATSIKQASPRKASTPRSLSSEEPQPGPPLTRRRTREQEPDEKEPSSPKADETMEDEEDEAEITRCVCTFQDYPGPPTLPGKTRDGQLASLADLDGLNEENSLFIQCDHCHVWQHGQCVGIMDEASTPHNYYCEECHPELHKLLTDSKGQRYSRYLPVYNAAHEKTTRKSSISKETESRATRDKERNALSRASVESFGKRRSTMNSRAAYDEDEVLRKVLEESKHEGPAAPSDTGTGSRRKRSRDESEDSKTEIKRQRTNSRTPSQSPAVESEDDNLKSTSRQKPRGAAARSQREKEQREKERERERAEAANRRKGRAERRKQEEQEAAEAAESPEDTPMAPAPATETAPPDTPLPEPKPAPAPRKSGRPPQKRGGRLGRNQYTRDAAAAANGISPAHSTPNSPKINAANGANNGHDSSDGTAGNKNTKSRNWRLEKLTWNDIRRPAGAMQNYIAQRQVELAGEKAATASAVQSPAPVNGHVPDLKVDAQSLEGFKTLSTLQMMDDLSRELTHWQRMVAQVTEK